MVECYINFGTNFVSIIFVLSDHSGNQNIEAVPSINFENITLINSISLK